MHEDPGASRPLPDLVGGRYRIVSRLGVGGMGVVYKAVDTQLNRAVAVKALEDRRRLLGGSERRLRGEALAAASLDHPYICKVYELVETVTETFIVMEYVEGETLASMLKRGPLPLAQALQLGREVAEGLADAHAHGLVHRDVKPSNVMVTPHGHVKLLDFGVAGADVASTPKDETRTLSPHLTVHGGTPQYMAPEQAAGQPVTARADLFSLGVLLYETLTAQLPFSGTTTFDYVRHVMQSAPRRLDRIAPNTPAALVDLIEQCLEKSPAARPESAQAVVDELRRLSDALSSPNASLRTAQQARAGRRWKVAALAILAAVAGAIGLNALWPRGDADGAPLRQSRPFLTTAAAEFGSRISPDAQWVAFLATDGGATRVMVQQIDGGEPRPLTLERGTPESLLWSPDGRQIMVAMSLEQVRVVQVYPAFFGGSSTLTIPLPDYVSLTRLLRWVDRDVFIEVSGNGRGPSLLKVTLGEPPRIASLSEHWTMAASVRAIDVHPDGRSVAIVRILDGREDLWTARLDGSSLRAVTQDAFIERSPLWSGRGDRIIVQSNRGGQLDLWEIDPGSGAGSQLTSGEMDTAAESTSADGSIISFSRLSQDAKLWLWTAATAGERQLTQDALSDYSPVVSADGRTIAFQRSQPAPSRGYTILDAKLMVAGLDPAGRLTNVRTLGDAYAASLSHDGAWIAFLEASDRPAHGALRVRNLTTGATQIASPSVPLPPLSRRPVDWLGPVSAWAADGELWFIDHTGLPSINRYRPGQDGPSAAVVRADADAVFFRDLCVSPDGRFVAYLSGTGGLVDFNTIDTRTSHARVVTQLDGFTTSLLLRGWMDGAWIFVRRTKLNDDFTADLEVLAVDHATGAARRIAGVTSGFIATARLDAARRALLVTRVEQGAHNLFDVSLATGAIRPITRNVLPGVTYSGYHAAPGGMIGVREERRQDIWLIQPAAAPRSGSPPVR